MPVTEVLVTSIQVRINNKVYYILSLRRHNIVINELLSYKFLYLTPKLMYRCLIYIPPPLKQCQCLVAHTKSYLWITSGRIATPNQVMDQSNPGWLGSAIQPQSIHLAHCQQRPESKTWAAQSRTYWWPAARELVTLLISGYLPALKLIHQSDCYPLRGRKSCEA